MTGLLSSVSGSLAVLPTRLMDPYKQSITDVMHVQQHAGGHKACESSKSMQRYVKQAVSHL